MCYISSVPLRHLEYSMAFCYPYIYSAFLKRDAQKHTIAFIFNINIVCASRLHKQRIFQGSLMLQCPI